MTARFENGKYRDCRWCGGRGCLSCPAEAEKEYQRQFPNGAKPLMTISKEDLGDEGVVGLLRSLIGPDAIMRAKEHGRQIAGEMIEANPSLVEWAEIPPEELATQLGTAMAGELIAESFVRAGLTEGGDPLRKYRTGSGQANTDGRVG